ncbi:helix-turn-helix domain-containing protein [Aestuariispira insulae]|uniref:Transcriptional regulator with XRE-family HTH domain n=1 Tax=Aestuariispira insulae TaxID=1461337 RepID=A0A3D9HRQ8_9PROT|nr:helix-turn-helix transcriptional regulator [Aestuariispira insulae]RED52194.1 transcriptional regulator with XRE-family HTH domain [Aestuariispira insulae]
MPHPTDVHVGQKIREVRIERGLSQDQLAGMLGISFQQIQKYEKGTNRIGSSRLYAICQALEIPVNYLFDDLRRGDGDPSMPSLRSIQVARDLEAIPDMEVRNRLLSLIRAIQEDLTDLK